MLALYRAGRQADALAAYQAARRALDEVGLEPSEELRRARGRDPAPRSEARRPPEAPGAGDAADRPPPRGRGGQGAAARGAARHPDRARRRGEDSDRAGSGAHVGRSLRRPRAGPRFGTRARPHRDRAGRRASTSSCSTTSSTSTRRHRRSPTCCGPRRACAAWSRAGARCVSTASTSTPSSRSRCGTRPCRCSSPALAPPGRRSSPATRCAAVCESLDRLPLALELVAARAPMRDLPARQRTPRRRDRLERRPARRAIALPLLRAGGVRRRLGRRGGRRRRGRDRARPRRAHRAQPDPPPRRPLHDARDDPRVRRAAPRRPRSATATPITTARWPSAPISALREGATRRSGSPGSTPSTAISAPRSTIAPATSALPVR